MKTVATSIVFILLMVISTSCQKDGPVGPEGTQGAQGTTGQDGADGPDATVVNFSLTYNNPSTTEFQFSSIWNLAYDGDDAILIYLEHPTTSNWVLTPYIWADNVNTVDIHVWGEITSTGMMIMNVEKYDEPNTYPWSSSSVTLDFRAMLIKASAKIANPDLDWNDYNEVQKRFNLGQPIRFNPEVK